jgi:predicted PurR-regulated permease PerM
VATRPSADGGLRFLVSVTLVIGIVYVARPVLLPLVLAALITFIFSPLVSFLERRGVGRAPSVVLVLVGALLLGVGLGYVIVNELSSLVTELPKHRDELAAKLQGLRGLTSGSLSRLTDMLSELTRTFAPHADATQTVVVAETPGRLGAILQGLIGTFVTGFLVLVLVAFMLLKREDLRNRAIALIGHGRLTGSTRAIVEAARRISRLLLAQLAVNVMFGLVWSLALFLLGTPYWALWGVLVAVLRFVPYIGIIAAAAPPILVSIAISPGWAQPVAVVVTFLVIDIATGNVVEPYFLGKRSGVAPIALLVTAAFWTWLWGPAGLVVSTPLTVILVVLGQHAPRLRFFSLLLGDQPPLPPHATYYQRLLASDDAEAYQVADEQQREHGRGVAFDDVLLPGLRLMRRERRLQRLDGHDEAYVLDATQKIVARLGETVPRTDADAPLVLACPAHHRSEEPVLAMLDLLCRPDLARVETVSSRTLAGDLVERVAVEKPSVVFVAILPPGGVTQARFLCRRIRERCPDARIVVGYFAPTRRFDRLLVVFRKAGASDLTTSLQQTERRLRGLLGAKPAD